MNVRVRAAIAAIAVLCACEGQTDRGKQEVLASIQSLGPSPDSDCDFASSSGRDYWFCDSERNWQTARTKCQAIGLDLAQIDSSAENTFIYNNITDNSWIGASDAAVEGTWRWASTNTLFWTGGASGTPASGIYTKWKSGQPANTSNQDCGVIEESGGGAWNDESCTGSREYVCEGIVDLCPMDMSKTVPGQCGCGNPETNTDGDSAADCVDGCDFDPSKIAPGTCGCGVVDTDSDGDGIANCVDGCPADSQKSAPGVCGCGTADGDADGDGAINCEDQCPQDPAKTTPGDCGCANAPAPSGTACADGVCIENTQCNGAGRCGNPSQCDEPDSDCELHMLADVPYWFCENDRPFSDVRSRCQSVGMDLVVIESQEEDDFITDKADEHSFIGGTDQATEGTWTWLATKTAFWSGSVGGSAIGGAYTNWDSGEPDSASEDCITKDSSGDGEWESHSCSTGDAFVCEMPDSTLREDEIFDADCDGLEDALETARGLNPADPSDGSTDLDSDGLDNGQELLLGGNPSNADTDGDSIADGVDLVADLDLDRDGHKSNDDNCPTVANPGQQDADSDDKGDVCDETPITTEEVLLKKVHVVRHTEREDFALRNIGEPEMSRLRGDLNGYVATGTSVLMFDEAIAGAVAVTELVHASNGRHAYAKSASEITTWQGRGFEVRGVFGYVAAASPGLAVPQLIRRFERANEQAVTVSAAEAVSLVADGYTEVSSLGWGLRDQGRLRKGKAVVRYRRAVDGVTLHTSHPRAEIGLEDFESESEQFQLLPEPNGWAVPLYRLRSASDAEVLSSSPSEVEDLIAAGYALDGVVGWIYRDQRGISTLNHLARLVRLEKAGEYEHSADPTQIAALKALGYGNAIVLGRVIRSPAADLDPTACVGRPDPLDRIDDLLGPTPPAGQTQITALLTFVSAYTMHRVLTGQIESPAEMQMAELFANLDAETRARLLRDVLEILNTSSAERAAMLGMLASMDPIGGTGPVDYNDVGYAVNRQALGAGAALFNQGVDGDVSLTRVRAPQCQGVTYGAGDPATANKAERAVTVGEDLFIGDPDTCTEFCTETIGQVKPVVFGVLEASDAVIPTGTAADGFADDHPDVGYSIAGTFLGACVDGSGNSACFEALGQKCVNSKCMQYPIVKAGTLPSFSGMNFWDGSDAQLIFTRVSDNDEQVFGAAISVDPLPLSPLPDEAELRCDFNPVDYSSATPLDAEKRLEQMQPHGPLALLPGNFYIVQARNMNGNYYHWGESIPIDPVERAENGRTIHICTGPSCDPPPAPAQAACELLPAMPECDGTVGGVWSTAPRSLDECEELFGPFRELGDCEETPRDFRSDATVSDEPRMIYVTDGDPVVHVQTQLLSVWCRDETGGDALGSDELMVWFGGLSSIPHWDEIEDIEGGFGYFSWNDADADEIKRPRRLVSSVKVSLGSDDRAQVVLRAAEDDDFDFEHVVAGAVGAAVGAVGGYFAGGGYGALAGGIGGGFGAFTAMLAISSPDDEIGQAAWQASLIDIQSRALLARDSQISMGPFPTAGQDPELFAGFGDLGFDKYLVRRNPGKHPSADASAYKNNDSIRPCTMTCTASQVCYANACVPTTWTDGTVPKGTFDPLVDLAGTIEHVHLDGEGEYIFYMATSLSDEDGLLP